MVGRRAVTRSYSKVRYKKGNNTRDNMASGFFGLLAKGASFAGHKDVAEFKKKQKKAKSGASPLESGSKRAKHAVATAFRT